MEGKFSQKSDVFSFGVLILEILSGRRNNSFVDDEWSMNLLGYVRSPCSSQTTCTCYDKLLFQ
jgi:hypothetical protein